MAIKGRIISASSENSIGNLPQMNTSFSTQTLRLSDLSARTAGRTIIFRQTEVHIPTEGQIDKWHKAPDGPNFVRSGKIHVSVVRRKNFFFLEELASDGRAEIELSGRKRDDFLFLKRLALGGRTVPTILHYLFEIWHFFGMNVSWYYYF